MTFAKIALASIVVGAAVAGPAGILREVRARVPALAKPRVRDVLVVVALVAMTMAVYDRMVRGVPPTTADHNFHLLKAVETENLLRRGHLTGWSDLELAGLPHNVLYPFAGTLVVAALDALPGVSLERAYAWTMLLVELVTVLGVWAIARLYYGRGVALVAGAMALFDPGSWGVGGYAFTTDIGVWPSAVSIVLGSVALALLPRAALAGTFRAALLPGALFGVAVLFHPATVVVTGFATPFLVFAMAIAYDPPPWRAMARVAGRVAVVALAICAFWFVPFVAQGRYVYHAPHITWPSASMWTALIDGYAFHQAGMFEGATICGLLMLARRRDVFSRLVVVFVPVALVVLTIDALKLLHLLGHPPDFFAARFQPERILYLARIFAMIAAAFALVVLAPRAAKFTDAPGIRGHALRLVLGATLALALVLPGARVPGLPMTPQGLDRADRADVERALDAAVPLLHGGRLALFSEPGDHTLVGPAAARDVPIEKLGTSASTMFATQFLTTDNVLWSDVTMLQRTGASVVLSKGAPPAWFGALPLVGRFGKYEVHTIDPLPRAWMHGPGSVRVVSWSDERVELDVTGSGGEGAVRLMMGYYDAWHAEGGGPVRRFVWHDQALAEVPARDGRIVLAYRRPASEWIGLGVSAAFAIAAAILFARDRRSARHVQRDRDVAARHGDVRAAAVGDGQREDEPRRRAPEDADVRAGPEPDDGAPAAAEVDAPPVDPDVGPRG